MKRKGGEVASLPCLTVKSLSASLNTIAISKGFNTEHESSSKHDIYSASAGENTSRDKTLKDIQSFMSKYNEESFTAMTSLISRNLELVALIEKEGKERPLDDAIRIQSKLLSRIEQEENIYRNENMDLVEIESSIRKTEEEIQRLANVKNDLIQETMKLKKEIDEYRVECAEEIEELDGIEAQMIQQIPRVKKRISLYSQATGIKWNYDKPNMVEGEINDEVRGSIRYFSFNPKELDQFSLANKIWDTVDAQ